MSVQYVVSQGVGKESGSTVVVIERHGGKDEDEVMLALGPDAVVEDWRNAELDAVGRFKDFATAYLAAIAIVENSSR